MIEAFVRYDKRHREREKERKRGIACVCACVCVCAQAPPGRTMPEAVLKLLTATHSALLVYKGGANDVV